MCTHRKHFEDLQPVRCPAFLGFVDRQWEVNIPGILREDQHQKDSPADRNQLLIFYLVQFTVEMMFGSMNHFLACLTKTPGGQSQSISLTATTETNQWQLQAHIHSYPFPVEREE